MRQLLSNHIGHNSLEEFSCFPDPLWQICSLYPKHLSFTKEMSGKKIISSENEAFYQISFKKVIYELKTSTHPDVTTDFISRGFVKMFFINHFATYFFPRRLKQNINYYLVESFFRIGVKIWVTLSSLSTVEQIVLNMSGFTPHTSKIPSSIFLWLSLMTNFPTSMEDNISWTTLIHSASGTIGSYWPAMSKS